MEAASERSHSRFDVYSDINAGGNHFVPSGWMSSDNNFDALNVNPCSTSRPRSGDTCIRVSYEGSGVHWAAVYWQNPENNWGFVPDVGFDLSGAAELSFWARGAVGGEYVRFFTGGLGWPNAPYRDSYPAQGTGYLSLTQEWQRFSIDLTGLNLSYVIGGFGFALSAIHNPSGATFFVDDVSFDVAHHEDLHFLPSYDLDVGSPHTHALLNTAFVYDNALALLAFLARGTPRDVTYARRIADAFVYAAANDRAHPAGWLRNAYQSGDLVHPGSTAARLPGRWDCAAEFWFEDEFQVSTHTGNVAWALLALIHFHENHGGDVYLDTALALGEWIQEHTYSSMGAGGYTGGYEGFDGSSYAIEWKSTEHAIDVYVAFMKLWELTGDGRWRRWGMWAKDFVRGMWAPARGHFWTGTEADGATINRSNVPVDVQAWALLALGERSEYGRGLAWCEENALVSEPCCGRDDLTGFDFNDDRDGIWWEGTAQVALSYQSVGFPSPYQAYLDQIRRVQECGPSADRQAIVSACHDGVTTGFDWEYHNIRHIGATAWYLFAELGVNPYWMIRASSPVPYEGEYQ